MHDYYREEENPIRLITISINPLFSNNNYCTFAVFLNLGTHARLHCNSRRVLLKYMVSDTSTRSRAVS